MSTAEGDVSIAAIEEGDRVLAWNESTNETGYYEVTDTFSHMDPVLTELIIDGEWIETTPEHPFYVEGKGWTLAKDLESGDQIRQADGTSESVWLKWDIHKYQEMYNLTVDEAHTFFVGDGQWLVHNSGCDIGSNITRLSDNLLNPPIKPGNAPTFKVDGSSVEIHHVNQNPKGPFKEMHWKEHRGAGFDLLNHPKKMLASLIDRVQWAKDKRKYWTDEWNSGRWQIK